MDMRQGSSENKIYFQSERIVRVNRGYFFQCRGDIEHGPYPDLKTANLMLTRFLEAKKFAEQSEQKNAANSADTICQQRTNTVFNIISEVPYEHEHAALELIETESQPSVSLAFKSMTAKKQVTHDKTPSEPLQQAVNVIEMKPKAAAPKIAAPKKIKHEIVIDAKAVDEYVLGAEIGSLSITEERENAPFVFRVDDDRFEVKARTLKLKESEYFDYFADNAVSLTIFAENDEEKSCERTLEIEVVPLSR